MTSRRHFISPLHLPLSLLTPALGPRRYFLSAQRQLVLFETHALRNNHVPARRRQLQTGLVNLHNALSATVARVETLFIVRPYRIRFAEREGALITETSANSGRWLALAMAGLAVVLTLTTWFSATAILPDLAARFDLDPADAGWLTNAVQVGFVVGALSSSMLSLADIWRLTTLMALACLAAALFNALLLIAPSFGIAIALRFATGAALALVYPPAMKFIATWFQTGRGLAMGTMVGALTLGSAMPHLLRGLGQELDWRVVILASSLGALIAAGLFTFAVREGPYAFARAKVRFGQIGAVLRNRPVMLANLGYFGHMWELYAMWSWFLAYCLAAQAGGLPLTNASLLCFAVIAMGTPGCIFCGWLADRIGRCLATSLMMALSASSALAIGFFFEGPFSVFAVIALIWGFTIVADSAQFSAAVSELSDQTLVASSLALQMGIGFALTIFVIWLTPIIAETLGGWRWTFLILVPGPLVGIAAMLALRRHPQSIKLAGGRR